MGGTGNVKDKPTEKSNWAVVRFFETVLEKVDSVLDPNGVAASDAQRAKQIEVADKEAIKKYGCVSLPTPKWRPGNADFKGFGPK